MIDDTNTTIMMYPSNKTISIADKNVSGVNIGTNGAAFTTNTIKIGNSNSKINLSGNVGIGTTTPGYKLDVVGDTHCSGDVYIGNNNDNDFGGRIYFGGTYGDNAYNHAQIVARKYQENEGSELLIYKGNDGDDRIRLKAYTIEFDIAGGALDNYATSDIKMTLASNGCLGVGKRDPSYRVDVAGSIRSSNYIISNDRIGIGTESPGYPLDIASGVNYNPGTTSTYWKKHVGLTDFNSDMSTSIKCSQGIVTLTQYLAVSDRRIKHNILDVDDDASLIIFRRLQPKTYEYIDKVKRGIESVYGFIAQEVKEVLPKAVNIITEIVPNIYELCSVTGDTLTLDTSKIEYDASGEFFPKLKLIKEDHTEVIVQILSVGENTIQIDKTLTEDQVFIYGQEVKNLNALNKDAIWTVAAAALQEVDRQLQAEKQKTQTLQEEVQTLKQTCGLLQQNYDQLLQRILSLESK